MHPGELRDSKGGSTSFELNPQDLSSLFSQNQTALGQPSRLGGAAPQRRLFLSQNIKVNRVTVLGSVNMDLVVRVPALPAPGETVLGDRLLTMEGGKGANQAAAAARLGAAVRFIGRVGADWFDEQLLRGLASDGVDLSGVTRDPEEPTGAALIVVEVGGQNTVTVAPGANSKVGEAEVARLVAEVGAGTVGLLQLEVPLPTVRAAAVAARAAGALVILNAAPAGPLLGQVLPVVDLLVVNEVEAAALTGQPVHDAPTAAIAAAWLGRSVRAVAVTLE